MRKIFSWLYNRWLEIKPIGKNPLEYTQSREQNIKTKEELQTEWHQLDEEAGQFLAEIGNKPMERWAFRETAWYESISRRQAPT